MENLDIDDVDFFPCSCGYQVCRFCWHRLKNDENGLCPACRQVCLIFFKVFYILSEKELQKLDHLLPLFALELLESCKIKVCQSI